MFYIPSTHQPLGTVTLTNRPDLPPVASRTEPPNRLDKDPIVLRKDRGKTVMPKTAPLLIKSVKVVVSISPAEFERWERHAVQYEMRVPEFVRYLVGQAIRRLDK